MLHLYTYVYIITLRVLHFSAIMVLFFLDGIPNDGIPIEEVVTVSVGLTVVYVILAFAGLVFAIVCLIFTLRFRKKKYVFPLFLCM